ncbi:ArsR/SmtB family transcription factor [Kocuria sp. M1R5S2]|uniref:ArsR/SmtB family transcription factor n=1 Tax=Kocuria rhizosphaerae TaxID=3376285 RepID=UPI00379FD0E0
MNGDELVATLSALSHPQRLRIVGALAGDGSTWVSQLARDLGISRPLLHLHLERLEAAGLVVSATEVAEDGKARRFVSLAPFDLRLDPETVARAAATVTVTERKKA